MAATNTSSTEEIPGTPDEEQDRTYFEVELPEPGAYAAVSPWHTLLDTEGRLVTTIRPRPRIDLYQDPHEEFKHRLAHEYGWREEYRIVSHYGYRADLAHIENGKVIAFYEVVKTSTPTQHKLDIMLQVCPNIYFVTIEGQVSRLVMPSYHIEHAYWLSER